MDAAWSAWINDNLARGVSRAEVYDELLIAGFGPEQCSRGLSAEFESIKARARSPYQQPRLEEGMKLTTHAGRGCEVFEVQNFLSSRECDHFVQRGLLGMQPSTILGDGDPRYVRTSRTSQIGLSDDHLIEQLEDRTAKLIGLPRAFSEPFQLHTYEPGDFFADHFDYLPESRLDAFDRAFGQRTWSILIYLEAPDGGGETVFENAGITIRPSLGTLIAWNNLDAALAVNPATRHRANAVTHGHKSILTKWFRLPTSSIEVEFPGERVRQPRFAHSRRAIDPVVLRALRAELDSNRHCAVVEEISHTHLRSIDPDGNSSEIIPISSDLIRRLEVYAAALLAEEIDEPLANPVVYGIRQYNTGASLRLHFDRSATHGAGVLLCIDRTNSQPWPLFLERKRGAMTAMEPEAGEVLVFAGETILHGRPRSLPDGHVWNLYVHFALAAE
ncbi:prolyl hydroxylase family protein [Novosphingobium sp. ZW T3_23]|uniref:prolyl hydroxylase family protein n=1 Tax=Novosphingobium sp. ZW T3_23 TaxID=3378084 RepID=UPI003854F41D